MIYLDNAATTYFKPNSVINAVGTALKYLSANPTRSSHSIAVKAGMMVEDTRTAAAKFFGCPPDKVIFTMSCTYAPTERHTFLRPSPKSCATGGITAISIMMAAPSKVVPMTSLFTPRPFWNTERCVRQL